MGNEIDSPGKQVNLINSSYVFVNSKDDLNYGEIKIYSRKGGSDLVAIITRSFSKESQKQKAWQQIEQRQELILRQLIHQNLLGVYGQQLLNATELCTQISVVKVLIEYLPKTLKDDMKQRINNKFLYSEQEIWYIIKSVCVALDFLNQQNQPYNDMHPTRVLLSEQGHLKLIDQKLLNEQLSNLYHVKLGYRILEYLAPEQIPFMYEKKPQRED